MNESTAIIQFTDAGLQHIRQAITAERAKGFRLAVKKTGCSGYAYVTELVNAVNSDDTHFLVEDVPVYVDSKAVDYLKGTTIDFVDQGLGQTKMIFHNPNAANLCGCGESFTLANE